MFLTIDDYKAVVDDQTLNVINQSDTQNLERAEGYAIDEISSYLRAAESSKTGIRPYDINAAFATPPPADGEVDSRNRQLVMYTCDVALYHLIAWLPKRIGFEIREIRYKRAIEWLESVQNGTVILDIPFVTQDSDEDAQGSIRFGSWGKNSYQY